MSHQIFISYSTKDTGAAQAVCAALESAGIACWMAPRDIPVGMTWASAIVDAINRSESVVLVLSASSNASLEVQREINRAASKKLPILTVRIENILPTDEMEYYLSLSQWLDAFDGPLENHLPALVEAATNPAATQLRHGAAAPSVDPQAERGVLDDLNWRIAELEHTEGPIRSTAIDDVFKSAIAHARRPLAAGQYETCDRFYTHAAEGVLRVLDAVPEQESLAWRNDVHQLQAALRPILALTADDPKEREKRVKELHRILVDFVGRLPLVEMRPLVRPATWMWTASLITISFVSLYLAYLHGTVTWELEYAYPFGPPSKTPRAGPYLEVARSIVLLAMALYLLESTLRPEYGRLLLDWSWKSWRMPLVGTFRCFGLASAVLLSWVVGSYILSTAPKNLTVEARHKVEKIKQDKADVQYLPEHLAALVRESQPGFLGHLEPYKWYLPYSWVNYVGFGLPLLVVTAFSVAGDAQRLIDERQGLFRVLSNARLPDAEINAAFGTFFDICFHHTQRYITILAWISGTIAFELIVSKGTLAPAGLMYEFLASAVVGALTLVWIGVLIHFYEGAYQRCCAEKRRRQKLSDEWEHKWRTTKFLYRCFFGHTGGIFVALYIVPFVLNFGRMWT